MPPRRKVTGQTPVEAIKHEDKRVNIPPAEAAELVDEEKAQTTQLHWPRDPSLDPQLVWKGKDATDTDALVVDAPPIYIQEKIDPRVLIENLRPEPELTLFDDPSFTGLSGWEAVEYYEHDANWSNRMILGDSLQVMASLAEKENLRGKVQMIYIDPPYGIKFGSNWQTSTAKLDVKDGKVADTTREVEQIKAFRDTWELGIHSYLAYLRDRLVVSHDLLTDSGSVFVQIGDENVHLVRSLLDEVFGAENFVAQVNFAKTAGATDEFVSRVVDYLLWYAKDIKNLKYRSLYLTKEHKGVGGGEYNFVQLSDEERISAKEADARGVTGRRFRFDNLTSQSLGRAKGEGASSWFAVEIDGRSYTPSLQSRWKTNEAGMKNLLAAGRVHGRKNSLAYVRYLDDFPAVALTTMWGDTAIAGRPGDKIYVVQTSPKVIERCVLMSTDPGDLILDPTCGSGSAAHVAEQWGRRWITIDTSRVALALARQRIMGAQYPFYYLADSPEGRAKEAEISANHIQSPNGTNRDVRKGFVYQRIQHVTLKSIANNPDIKEGMSRKEIDAAIARHAESELLYDRPYEDKKKVRVAGRFTVESLAPHRTVAPETKTDSEKAADETADSSSFEQTIIENLRTAGVQNGRKKERLEFATLETHAGKFIQAFGEPKDGEDHAPERIAVSIGPQYGTVDAEWVKSAAREAIRGRGAEMLLVCAFAFDPQAVPAAKEFAPSDPNDFAAVQAERRLGRLPILFVRMNSDLVMGDVLLKKTKTANLFMVFGEPDVAIEQSDDEITVEIRGVDVYNPSTGEIRSSSTDEIALWMIDTEYTGESFFVRHCYFTGGQDPYKKLKRSLRAEIDEAAWQSLHSTRSRPFPKPESGKIAVKVINHYGDEVLQIYDV